MAQPAILLIVEDDELLLRAQYLLFHREGNTIATATDGEMAIKLAERLHPSIILLDLLLPKLDGFEVLHVLKSNPKLRDIPVVVLSNLGDPKDVARAKELGAIDYFVKANTDLSVLAEKVNQILAKANVTS